MVSDGRNSARTNPVVSVERRGTVTLYSPQYPRTARKLAQMALKWRSGLVRIACQWYTSERLGPHRTPLESKYRRSTKEAPYHSTNHAVFLSLIFGFLESQPEQQGFPGLYSHCALDNARCCRSYVGDSHMKRG